MSVEQKIAKWLEQPGTFVTAAKSQFIADMRSAADRGVGYGWMQQIIEWEWQSKGPGSHGPEYYHKLIKELEARLTGTKDEGA